MNCLQVGHRAAAGTVAATSGVVQRVLASRQGHLLFRTRRACPCRGICRVLVLQSCNKLTEDINS